MSDVFGQGLRSLPRAKQQPEQEASRSVTDTVVIITARATSATPRDLGGCERPCIEMGNVASPRLGEDGPDDSTRRANSSTEVPSRMQSAQVPHLGAVG